MRTFQMIKPKPKEKDKKIKSELKNVEWKLQPIKWPHFESSANYTSTCLLSTTLFKIVLKNAVLVSGYFARVFRSFAIPHTHTHTPSHIYSHSRNVCVWGGGGGRWHEFLSLVFRLLKSFLRAFQKMACILQHVEPFDVEFRNQINMYIAQKVVPRKSKCNTSSATMRCKMENSVWAEAAEPLLWSWYSLIIIWDYDNVNDDDDDDNTNNNKKKYISGCSSIWSLVSFCLEFSIWFLVTDCTSKYTNRE